MKPEVLVINRKHIDVNIIQRAAKALRAGKLVVMPTETVYGIAANADSASAMRRLRKLKNRMDEKPFTFHLDDLDKVHTYISDISAPGKRLMNRYWPGPLTLIFPHIGPLGLGLRVVGDKIAQKIISAANVPIVATSANLPDEKPAITGFEAKKSIGSFVDIIIEAGTAQFQDASAVVAVAKQAFNIKREGVIGAANILKTAKIKIYLVCTGNVVRSPMARALLLHLIDQDAKALLGENFRRALQVETAGISSAVGEPVSKNALEVLKEFQADDYVKGHRAQTFHRGMLEDADKIFVMTKSQLKIIRGYDRHLAPKVHLLDPENKGISDPAGKSKEAHRKTARKILQALQKRFFAS